MVYLQLFLSFLKVGMFSIGGGYAAMPLIQSEIVNERGWLTMREFTDLITIAEMTPGPIAVNSATFVGIRIAGIWGAAAATFGCIFPSCIIVSLLAVIYYKYNRVSTLQNILASLRPAVVALIAGAGISLLRTVAFGDGAMHVENVNWAGIFLFAAAFVLLRKRKWNPILVMALCGAANMGIHIFFETVSLHGPFG